MKPWWWRIRKHEMPADGTKILVVLDRKVFGETKPIPAVVRYDGGIWRVYEADIAEGHRRTGVYDNLHPGLLPFFFDLELDNEGVTWARGWDTPEAKALVVAEALR